MWTRVIEEPAINWSRRRAVKWAADRHAPRLSCDVTHDRRDPVTDFRGAPEVPQARSVATTRLKRNSVASEASEQIHGYAALTSTTTPKSRKRRSRLFVRCCLSRSTRYRPHKSW